MHNLATKLSPYAPTALRVALGLVFLLHAYMKLFVYTLPGTAAFFEANGYPGALAYPVFAIEALGGVLLVAGLGTRWVAAALVPIMLGAVKPHLASGAAFNNPGGGYEFPLLLVVLLAIQVVLGAGAWSLDHVINARAGRNPARRSVMTAA